MNLFVVYETTPPPNHKAGVWVFTQHETALAHKRKLPHKHKPELVGVSLDCAIAELN